MPESYNKKVSPFPLSFNLAILKESLPDSSPTQYCYHSSYCFLLLTLFCSTSICTLHFESKGVAPTLSGFRTLCFLYCCIICLFCTFTLPENWIMRHNLFSRLSPGSGLFIWYLISSFCWPQLFGWRKDSFYKIMKKEEQERECVFLDSSLVLSWVYSWNKNMQSSLEAKTSFKERNLLGEKITSWLLWNASS